MRYELRYEKFEKDIDGICRPEYGGGLGAPSMWDKGSQSLAFLWSRE